MSTDQHSILVGEKLTSQNGRCAYCNVQIFSVATLQKLFTNVKRTAHGFVSWQHLGVTFTGAVCSIEHLRKRRFGGGNTKGNIILLCEKCNGGIG